MPTRPIEPNGNAGGPMTPFIVLGLAWAVICLLWLAWAAGWLARLLSGGDRGPRFGTPFITGLLRGDWARIWPGTPLALVGVVFTVLLAVVATAAVLGTLWWQRRKSDPHDPLPALADAVDLQAMSLAGTAERARRLRRGLAGQAVKEIEAESAGVLLGEHRRRGGRGGRLYASWEDVLLAVMAPRAGKTTGLAVPAVLNAPGPAVATSNKLDLWATTAAARAEHGAVWVFDPQRITHTKQDWWWNPLAAVASIEDAQRLADQFVQQIRNGEHGGDDFWSLGALDLLTSLILAAAVDRQTLLTVQAWLSDSTARQPAAILRAHGYVASARALAGRQAGAPETREGIYETARTAAACLANPQIMAWVTPGAEPLPALDIAAFARSTDTIYLLSKDGAGNAAPLVAGLTDQLLRAAVTAAELGGGRLDPPMVACLDEAANICKIRDLPELYSHFGSRGIVPLTILQSYRQGTRVWGERGMDALWSAATVKLVGAGVDDARFAEDLSRLIGEHDVTVASRTRDGHGGTSYQTSVRRQRILDPAQIRALPKGTGLLLATGIKVAMLNLLPWYDGPRAAELAAAEAAANAHVTTLATASVSGRASAGWPATRAPADAAGGTGGDDTDDADGATADRQPSRRR